MDHGNAQPTTIQNSQMISNNLSYQAEQQRQQQILQQHHQLAQQQMAQQQLAQQQMAHQQLAQQQQQLAHQQQLAQQYAQQQQKHQLQQINQQQINQQQQINHQQQQQQMNQITQQQISQQMNQHQISQQQINQQISQQQIKKQQISPQHQMSPQQISQHQMSPQQISQHQMSPQQVSQHQMSPQQINQLQMSPQQISQHQMSPQQIGQHQMSPQQINQQQQQQQQINQQQQQQQLNQQHQITQQHPQQLNQQQINQQQKNSQPQTVALTTETVVKTEPTPIPTTSKESDKLGDLPDITQENGNETAKLLAILQFLKKHNLQETEGILRKETKLLEGVNCSSDVSSVLDTYKSEGDPNNYEGSYSTFKKFIESALDSYRHELAQILYPVFVHMYLELVYNEHEQQAVQFMKKFGLEQEEYYLEDIKRLSCLTTKDHMKGNEFMDNFRSGQFTVRLSRDTYNFLKRFLQDKKNNILQNIIQEHLYLDVYEGITRTKQQVDATSGAFMGEAARQANKSKIFYGLLKEPEIHVPLDDDEETPEGEDKPKKKKPKKDPLLSKKARNDPNAPPVTRIPLPELRDADKADKIVALREATKRLKLGPDCLPSICFYTFLNAHQGVTCAEVSEDSSLLVAGFADSVIRVWSMSPNKLKGMKPASELDQIDKEADDVLYRMMDERNATEIRILLGHNGPIYSTSISFDRTSLLSCSEDSTIRLWSLQTWTNIMCYKGHCFPVWDVRFSPHGYYFASSGHDRTARLWATDQHQPIRVFAGHVSDVDCVQFHPNSNYIATGSTDRTIRLWDVLSGSCVRYMTGHKGRIYVMAFSSCGRFLTTAGADKKILVWDIAHGHLVSELQSHTDTIYTLCFSREGTVLASGGTDCCVKLWNMAKLYEELDLEDLNMSHAPNVRTNTEGLLLGNYPTKSTSVLTLHFTRRNLLLCAGMYH